MIESKWGVNARINGHVDLEIPSVDRQRSLEAPRGCIIYCEF